MKKGIFIVISVVAAMFFLVGYGDSQLELRDEGILTSFEDSHPNAVLVFDGVRLYQIDTKGYGLIKDEMIQIGGYYYLYKDVVTKGLKVALPYELTQTKK